MYINILTSILIIEKAVTQYVGTYTEVPQENASKTHNGRQQVLNGFYKHSKAEVVWSVFKSNINLKVTCW